MRVMIAMSMEGVDNLIQSHLGERGHRVESASHKRDIAAALKARDLDIVVLDSGWMTVQGLDTLAPLKRHAARGVRFVLMEEYPQGATGDLDLSGFDTVLASPTTLRQIIEVVEQRQGRGRYQPDIQRRGLAG